MKTRFFANGGKELRGNLVMPGDKSISHRAIMCGALAQGVTKVTNCLMGDDVKATIGAFKSMGVQFKCDRSGSLLITGKGRGLVAPTASIHLGNSGTSMRLMTGILSGLNIPAELDGDSSLRSRPMARIATPLRTMGADIKLRDGNIPPVSICRAHGLKAIEYALPVASAQVKSAILFAALFAEGTTVVKEKVATRDHTERMFERFGVDLAYSENGVAIRGRDVLRSADLDVPGDISSAAFFLVGGIICRSGGLRISDVGLNPTRIGVIEILRQMGAKLEIENERLMGNEPVGDIIAYPSSLEGITIDSALIASSIDEFPIIFIAAACAKGKTILRAAKELRHKESDRLEVMAKGLGAIGIDVQVFDDGLQITGGEIEGGSIDANGDHRVAMAFAIASLRSRRKIVINNAAQISTSFPNFFEVAETAGLGIGW